MSDYRLTATSTVIRVSDGAFVPCSPENRDWISYQSWLADGNVPDPYMAPPPLPVISYAMLRARLTDAEREAILTACRTNWQLDDFVRLAQAEGKVNLSSVLTGQAETALVEAGLLSQERASIIFAPPV